MFKSGLFSDDDAERLLLFCRDRSLGTLWWVKNTLWKALLPQIGEQDPENRHPGLSLLRKTTHCLGAVPMLFGTSKKPTGKTDTFTVQGVTRDRQLKTHFGVLPHRGIAEGEFAAHAMAPCLLPTGGAAEHQDSDEPRVTPNRIKPILSSQEKASLEEWMQRRGIWA